MAGEVRYEVRGGAAWVTIDREEHRNALSPEVVIGLRAAIDRVGGDDAARVAVITGAGDRAFSAGGDLGGVFGGGFRGGPHDARGGLPLLFPAMQEGPTPGGGRGDGPPPPRGGG